MSEIKIFYKDKEKIKVARTISALKELDKKDIIWIDLLDVQRDNVQGTKEDRLEWFLTRRPEQLSVDEFVELTKLIQLKIKN